MGWQKFQNLREEGLVIEGLQIINNGVHIAEIAKKLVDTLNLEFELEKLLFTYQLCKILSQKPEIHEDKLEDILIEAFEDAESRQEGLRHDGLRLGAPGYGMHSKLSKYNNKYYIYPNTDKKDEESGKPYFAKFEAVLMAFLSKWDIPYLPHLSQEELYNLGFINHPYKITQEERELIVSKYFDK